MPTTLRNLVSPPQPLIPRNPSNCSQHPILPHIPLASTVPRLKAIRQASMSHTERANNEAMLHLGQGVMTTSEDDQIVHRPHERWLVASDGHNNQGDASGRQGSRRVREEGKVVLSGRKNTYGGTYGRPGTSLGESATARSKSSIFTNASSRLPLSSQPSGRVMTPGEHDIMGRRHTHHHHLKKMMGEKQLSITGHQRNENIADAVAKGANEAEER